MINAIFQSPIYTNGDIFPVLINGQRTINVSIIGTISAGYLTPQVSSDGIFWESIDTIAQNIPSEITLNQAGTYIIDVDGWAQFQLVASADFSASCTTQYFILPYPILTKIINPISISSIAPNWVAGTYAANSIVIYNGTFWSNTLSTSGVPGVSGWNNYTTLADLLTFILSN
jgi:hypothetical protein